MLLLNNDALQWNCLDCFNAAAGSLCLTQRFPKLHLMLSAHTASLPWPRRTAVAPVGYARPANSQLLGAPQIFPWPQGTPALLKSPPLRFFRKCPGTWVRLEHSDVHVTVKGGWQLANCGPTHYFLFSLCWKKIFCCLSNMIKILNVWKVLVPLKWKMVYGLFQLGLQLENALLCIWTNKYSYRHFNDKSVNSVLSVRNMDVKVFCL